MPPDNQHGQQGPRKAGSASTFYSYLSGREHLELVGRLRGLAAAPLEARIERFLGLLQQLPHQSAAIESYSKGMRQKLAIAGALLHDPVGD